MTHTTTIDAAAVRAALAQAPPPLMPKATDAASLTDAERAVLHWLAAGRSNAQIGLCVGRSEKTVRNQLTRVYAKLGVTNRAQAVAMHMRMEFGRHERR
jgi:DNA-binding CsgD family transcriptional regulator